MTDSFEVREKKIEKNSCLVGYVMFGRTVQERTREDRTVVVGTACSTAGRCCCTENYYDAQDDWTVMGDKRGCAGRLRCAVHSAAVYSCAVLTVRTAAPRIPAPLTSPRLTVAILIAASRDQQQQQ